MQILDSLIEEDDSVPNVWYMLAMCLLGGGQTEAAAEALQHGQKLLRKQSDADELAKDFSDLKVCRQAVRPFAACVMLIWWLVSSPLGKDAEIAFQSACMTLGLCWGTGSNR